MLEIVMFKKIINLFFIYYLVIEVYGWYVIVDISKNGGYSKMDVLLVGMIFNSLYFLYIIYCSLYLYKVEFVLEEEELREKIKDRVILFIIINILFSVIFAIILGIYNEVVISDNKNGEILNIILSIYFFIILGLFGLFVGLILKKIIFDKCQENNLENQNNTNNEIIQNIPSVIPSAPPLEQIEIIIPSAPPEEIKNENEDEDEDEDKICAICMERDVNNILECNHRLCEECLVRINEFNRKCPFCRSTFS